MMLNAAPHAITFSAPAPHMQWDVLLDSAHPETAPHTLPGTTFDVVVANPPYLSATETAETPVEVRSYEPVSALTAGDEGFADLAAIIAGAPKFLGTGGLLAVETGIAQHARLVPLAQAAGFSRVESRRDLTGRDRFIFAWK